LEIAASDKISFHEVEKIRRNRLGIFYPSPLMVTVGLKSPKS